jgi:hypothetical protein
VIIRITAFVLNLVDAFKKLGGCHIEWEFGGMWVVSRRSL